MRPVRAPRGPFKTRWGPLFCVQTRAPRPFLSPGLSGPCVPPPGTPSLGIVQALGALLTGSLLGAQVSALRRLAKPLSERAAGRVGLKPAMLDSGAEVSASTTSSEAESGARSVSSIVRQWNRKINHFLGDHPASAGHGARPAR